VASSGVKKQKNFARAEICYFIEVCRNIHTTGGPQGKKAFTEEK